MINMIGTRARNNPEYLTLSPRVCWSAQTRGPIEGNEGEKIVKIEQFLLLSWPGPVWPATTGNNRISKQFRTVVGVANECDGAGRIILPRKVKKITNKKNQWKNTFYIKVLLTGAGRIPASAVTGRLRAHPSASRGPSRTSCCTASAAPWTSPPGCPWCTWNTDKVIIATW